MVEEDARRLVGEVVQDGLYRDGFEHHDWDRKFTASLRWRLYEQPFGSREPLVAAYAVVEKNFKVETIDLARLVKDDADSKTSQRGFQRRHSTSLLVEFSGSHGSQFRQPNHRE
ncbi:hypothetical protein [Brevundimonas intermedia]|uniref:hypothetical protein n=1 Tax=Brevundimonas intermedia TaxID=74315 RepID=UPI00320B57A3